MSAFPCCGWYGDHDPTCGRRRKPYLFVVKPDRGESVPAPRGLFEALFGRRRKVPMLTKARILNPPPSTLPAAESFRGRPIHSMDVAGTCPPGLVPKCPRCPR